MQALLELDCIPSGMELFPAASEDQWTLIKRVIDECDYYVVISAGRYGSIGPQGYSYTEQEYRYAKEVGKPVIAFLHKDPQQLTGARLEQTDEARKRLTDFRDSLQERMCKFWTTPADLGSVVSRSLVRLIKTNPAVGWVRADQITDALAAAEVLRLKRTIEELEGRLRAATFSAPPGSDRLAQGNDIFEVDFTFDSIDRNDEEWSWSRSVGLSWNEIFSKIGPAMLDESPDQDLRLELNRMVKDQFKAKVAENEEFIGHRFRGFEVVEHDFNTIKIQLRALGLIDKSSKPRSIKDQGTYWSLTPYGDRVLTKLRAIPRELAEEASVDHA